MIESETESMATKAERFHASAERSGPKKAKAPKRPRRDVVVDTAQPGVSATDRKAGAKDSARRNASERVAKKGGAVLESSAGKPSRKSTRKSSGRAKQTTNLELREERRISSPTARARRAKPSRKASAKAKAKQRTTSTKK